MKFQLCSFTDCYELVVSAVLSIPKSKFSQKIKKLFFYKSSFSLRGTGCPYYVWLMNVTVLSIITYKSCK